MTGSAWTRTRRVSAVAAIALAGGLLVYSLRGIDWAHAAAVIRGASPSLLALAVVISTTTLFLRAVRWRVLLTAEGSIGLVSAFRATAAGYFANNFLPARAGELVRTYLVSSSASLEGGFVLTTALAERVADAIVLALLSAAILLAMPSPPGWFAGAARPAAVAGLLGAGAIAVVPLLEPAFLKLANRLPLPASVDARVAAIVGGIARGLRSFHDAKRLTGFFLLTAAIWGLDAAGAVVGASALGLRLPLSAAFLLIAGLSLGSALPSTPGYVGIYQFVAVTVLTPFGFSRSDAIAFILVAQALMYLVVGVWGGMALATIRTAPRSTDR
jgi:uncharacterized membrane protein YbhN (UPF0104 family)